MGEPAGIKQRQDECRLLLYATVPSRRNACLHFASRGYPVMELEGGFGAWKENELELEEESASRFKTSGEQRLSSRH